MHYKLDEAATDLNHRRPIYTMSQSTASKPLLVVLGATGNQGKAVLKHFLSSGKFSLRAITRNTHSPAAEDLEQQGIETFQADLNDQSSLERAFLGAIYIFATTDSNQLIFQAIEKPDLLDNGETPRDYAKRIELAQGRNIADAAAKTETLQRIVWSSLPGPKKWSHGKYSKVSMFDTKEEISEILGSKVELKDKLSVLLIGFYATNALKVKDLYGPSKVSVHASYLLFLLIKNASTAKRWDLRAGSPHVWRCQSSDRRPRCRCWILDRSSIPDETGYGSCGRH